MGYRAPCGPLFTAVEESSQHGGAERPECTSQEHTSVTTTCRTTTDEKTRTCQRRSVTTKDVKKGPQQDAGEWWTGNTVKPHISRWVTHRTNTLHRLSQRSGSSGPMPGSVAWGSFTRRQAPKESGFEGQWGFISGAPEDWGNRDFTPKGRTQHLIDSRIQHKSSHLTGAWSA